MDTKLRGLFFLVVGVFLMIPTRWVCIFLFFFLTLIFLPVMSEKEVTLSPAGYDFGSPWINLFTNPMVFFVPERSASREGVTLYQYD